MVRAQCAETWRAGMSAAARPVTRATPAWAAATTTSVRVLHAAVMLCVKIYRAVFVAYAHQVLKETLTCYALVSLIICAPIGVTYANPLVFCGLMLHNTLINHF